MKPYLVTTGSLFALLTIVHAWRMVAEPGIAANRGSAHHG